MSLHATQQVGIPVPENVIRGAVDYTKKMVGPDGKVGYQNPNEDHPALRGPSAAGLCHRPRGETAGGEEDRWSGSGPTPSPGKAATSITALTTTPWASAAPLPEEWEKYLPKYEAVLLPLQKEDGSFDTSVDGEAQDGGPIYTTSMAVMALAVQRHVLPAYQR